LYVKTAAYPNLALEIATSKGQEIQNRLNQPSATARLAIVLFSTGLALLVVGFFSQ
jgi:hypothetical protein